MPDGSRHSRRFLQSDALQSLFDYVDIYRAQQAQQQAGAEPGGAGAAAAAPPGRYSLVSSYPRRVLEEGQGGSLAEVGITADSALFLEPKP